MQPFEHNGKKFTNADAWRTAKATQPKRAASAPGVAEAELEPQEEHSPITLHSHGDGTFHTETEDGERVEHPHIGHALNHIKEHAGAAFDDPGDDEEDWNDHSGY